MRAHTNGQDMPRVPTIPRLTGWAQVFGCADDAASYGKYVVKPSPNRKFKLVFDPGCEYSMMRHQHAFRLVDSSKKVVQAFLDLSSQVQFAWWSPDSKTVAVPVDDQDGGLLLFDVQRQRYSLILFSPYQETATLTSTSVRTSVDRGIAACHAVFACAARAANHGKGQGILAKDRCSHSSPAQAHCGRRGTAGQRGGV